MRFNPFEKQLSELNASDLGLLLRVSEGLYVEYKRELPAAISIAKSISAFANHNGGWLFYGVEEESNDNTAASFPGLDTAQLQASLARIRDAAFHHVSPPPYFESRPIHGPCDEIGLPRDRSIVALTIPIGRNPPYVHSSGRIFRRFADSSEPHLEIDRAVIDQMTRRARVARKGLRKFLTRNPEFAEAEKDSPYLQLFLLRDPLNEEEETRRLLFPEFVDAMRSTQDEFGGFTCDNIFASNTGYVARQVADNPHGSKTLTWEFIQGGSSIVTAPIRSGSSDLFNNYKYGADLLGRLADPARIYRVLDLTTLLALLNAFVAKHRTLCAAAGLRGRMFAKVRLHNTWRRIPFLDTAGFRDFSREYGLPLIQYKKLFAPAGTSLESLIPLWISEADCLDDENPKSTLPVELFSEVMEALGIPPKIVADGGHELFEAVGRAPGVRRIRS